MEPPRVEAGKAKILCLESLNAKFKIKFTEAKRKIKDLSEGIEAINCSSVEIVFVEG